MSEVKSKAFPSASKAALDDAGLQRLLGRVVHGFSDLRDAAVEEVTEPVWEQLRERARSIKQQTLANLDYYLELVDRSVTRNGGHVHFAKDADEANRIVVEIAKRHDVKRVVKSKSMVSEEMGINQVLEANGIEPVETDLGEYIIQLAKETPFHIIAPALHKSREQVSDLFHDWLKSQPTNEIEELCRIARDELRDKFATADMGITGANLVVAETGTVMLVTNEGNGRMTTSAPRVLVTLAGMEKVVPALEDLATFIRLLPRSATGQRISTYTTFMGGPRSAGDEDGPEEYHLVLVDNGRMNVLRDPEMREALQCIRCGACLNVCPVYRKVGGHAYGWVYSGPIGAILTPLLVGMDQGKELPFASSLCGACKDVCPVKIDIPRLLLRLRSRATEGGSGVKGTAPWIQKLMVRRWFSSLKTRQAMDGSAKLARLVQRPVARGGRIKRIPLPVVSGWTQQRDFPAVAPKSFSDVWRDGLDKP